jgi:hypothetical protein
MIVWRSFDKVGGIWAHFCHIWPVKKDIRYNRQPLIGQAYDFDPKSVRLAELADGLLRPFWASRLCKAGECTAKTVELKNSERSER